MGANSTMDDMQDRIEIRESLPADQATLESLYPAAFPDEDLLPVLRALLDEDDGVLSLVAISDGALVGHVAFTMCRVAGHEETVGLLAPLAVIPKSQRRGVGSALVQAGFVQLRDQGISQVYVLGDPAYYGRFGFRTESRVMPPYDLPKGWEPAWQSVSLTGTQADLAGRLCVPAPWRQRALWAP